jgi:protein-disulfide isomerase
MEQIVSTYKDQVRLVFKNYPLKSHGLAFGAAEAAMAAHEQGRFWEMHDLLLKNRAQLQPENLYEYARQLGLDMQRFRRSMEEHTFKDHITKDIDEARGIVRGTPNFLVNGRMVSGAKPFETFKKIIDEELAKKNTKLEKNIVHPPFHNTLISVSGISYRSLIPY